MLRAFAFALFVSVHFGWISSSAAQNVTLRLGHVAKPTEFQGVFSDRFAKEVTRLTNGQVRIAVFGGAQLGGERDLLEGVRLGTIDMYNGGASVAARLYSPVEVLALPWLFKSEEHFRKAMMGNLGRRLLAGMDGSGLKGLAFHSGGFRHVVNSIRPIRTPNDIKGLKLRVREVDLEVETFRALGATTVPIPYPELYTSLQTRVVDGFELDLSYILSGKLYEVTKHVSFTGHFQSALVLLMDLKKFNALSPNHQAALLQSAEIATKVANEYVDTEIERSRKELIKVGVQLNTVQDVTPFVQAVQPVQNKFLAKQPAWVQEVVRETIAAGQQ